MNKIKILEKDDIFSNEKIKEAMSLITDEQLREIRLSLLKLITQPCLDRWFQKKDNAINVISECVLALSLMGNHYNDDFKLPFDVNIFEEAIEYALGNELKTMRENRDLGAIIEAFVLFGCPANQIINAYSVWKKQKGYRQTKLKYSRGLIKQGNESDSIIWLSVYYPTIKEFILETENTKFPTNSVQYADVSKALADINDFFSNDKIQDIICRDMNNAKMGDGIKYYTELYNIIKDCYPALHKNGHFLIDQVK